MEKQKAKESIEKVFNDSFDEHKFRDFMINFLPGIDENRNNQKKWQTGNYVPEAYRNHIRRFRRLGQYTDPDGELLDVLLAEVTKPYKLERTRGALRNFAIHYLKGKKDSRDTVLIAYFASDYADWRLSYIKITYTPIEKNNKITIEKEITYAKRYSFLVGKNEPNHTAQQYLLPLLTVSSKPYLKDIEDAFNIEKVTEEFFEKYRDLFILVKDELEKIVQKDAKLQNAFQEKAINTVDFTKKLLGQIVFLYFLQKKGWFGVRGDKTWGTGSKRFLRELFEKKHDDYKNFFNDILEPLFYEALSLEHQDDYYSRFDCRIPFLNGGLFEPLKNYDWVNTDILLPNSLFSNKEKTKEGDIGSGILDIFDRYNFTVKEDEPLEKEVAVDPEMLGKVFENLLEIKDRKSKGAYYTPREIVHYMCQESLINYLTGELKEKAAKEEIEKFIKISDSSVEHDTIHLEKKSEDKAYKGLYEKAGLPYGIKNQAALIDKELASIRVCDPAVGSGAFLVGMMNEIIRARTALTPYIRANENGNTKFKDNIQSDARTAYHFKRHAIEHCLYGVDIDSGAIEIAKLRLWLSLVVDEEEREPIQPLPNLDYKMVCGNSLLSVKKNLFNGDALNELEDLKPLYFNETSSSKKQNYKAKMNEIIDKVTEGQKTFDFKIYFSEVFHEKKGFDVVIANPPYIKEYVNKSAFDGLRESPYYQGKMDIWYLFACNSIDILKQNQGIVAFIAQSNWVTSFGASKMRNKVIKDTQILNLIDFGDFKIFSAGIQTMVMLFKRTSLLEKYTFDYRKLNGKSLEFKEMISVLKKGKTVTTEYINPEISRRELKNKKLTFNNPEVENFLNRLSSKANFQLTDIEVAQGIVCPQDYVNKASQKALRDKYKIGDGVFVIDNKEKDQLLLTKKELAFVKPYYTSKELFRWYGNPKNKSWVIYTDSSFKNIKKIREYPNIKKHLDQFKKIITSDNKPYGLHRARKESFFKDEKILSIRKCTAPTFTYVDFDSYVSAAFYVIKTNCINQKYLTGILNSKLIALWLKNKGKMQGSNYQIDKEPLLSIPIIKAKGNEQKDIINLVDKILSVTKSEDYLKNSSKQKQVAEYEKQIDQLIYKLYQLTSDEVKIVEGS